MGGHGPASPRQDRAHDADLDGDRCRGAGSRGLRPRRRAGVLAWPGRSWASRCEWAPCRFQQRVGEDPRRRAVRQARRAGRLRPSRRRRGDAGDDSLSRDRRQNRFAGHQPRRPGRVRHRGCVGCCPDVAQAGPRTVRPGRVRPARGGVVAAGDLVQLRCRQRPVADRAAGRLQPGGCGAHRGRDQAVRRPLCRQDGQELPGECRDRQRRQGSGRHPRGVGRRQADLPRLLVRHPDRLRLRRGLPDRTCGR